jgi:hypothetical protein
LVKDQMEQAEPEAHLAPHKHLEQAGVVDLVVMLANLLHLLHQPVAAADYMAAAQEVVPEYKVLTVELLPALEQAAAVQYALFGG